MIKTLNFKSTPDNFRKEYLNLKRNTVRVFKYVDNDIRQEICEDWINGKLTMVRVEITNTNSNERFEKDVVDIAKYQDTYIISW